MNIQVRASTALLGYGRRSGTHDLKHGGGARAWLLARQQAWPAALRP
jgi:hypothetical protein